MILFLLPLLAMPVSSTLEHIGCYLPRNFAVDLSNRAKAYVNEAELSVQFSRDKLRVYTYSGMNAANIVLKDMAVTFKGNWIPGNSAEPEKIDRTIYLQTNGSANLKNSRSDNCEVHLTIKENDEQSTELQNASPIEKEFRKYAEKCIKSQLCRIIKSIQLPNVSQLRNLINSRQLQNQNRSSANFPPTPTPRGLADSQLQTHINFIIDAMLAELVKLLQENHQETIQIPDIDYQFSTGSGIFSTKGRFTATDGYFSDLTTLKRTNDGIINNQGLKLSVSCGFGLSTAKIDYKNYRIKYGFINVSGKLSASIQGISVDAKGSVDYNIKPCKAEFEYIKITEFGKVEIKVTGLGPLNSLASFLSNWMMEKWHSDIAKLVEKKAMQVISKHLNSLNCEKYRP